MDNSEKSGTIGQIASILAVVGVTVQALSYVVAYNFYSLYGVKPSDIGITPLNAVFRMHETGIVLGILLSLFAGMTIMLLSLVRNLWQRPRKSTFRRPPPPWAKEQRRFRYIKRLTALGALAVSLKTQAVRRSSLARQVILSILLIATPITFTLGIVSGVDAGIESKKNSDSTSEIESLIQIDLAPTPVYVQWSNPVGVPEALPERNDGSMRYFAYYLGSRDGTHILYFDLSYDFGIDENVYLTDTYTTPLGRSVVSPFILTVPTSDVVIFQHTL